MPSKSPGEKMGPWRKAPPSMVALFDEVLPGAPEVERRKMFGYPAGFANGHMFMGLFQEHLVLRLDTADREAFLRLPEAQQFEPMPGRPMREYVMATPSMLEDTDELRPWIKRSLGFVLSLPPKEAKAKAAKPKTAKPKAAKTETAKTGTPKTKAAKTETAKAKTTKAKTTEAKTTKK
ncbi:MAG TPA: TfoX/Sxy family protein [Polyangia bacterium]|nr:TfoX/Sxy family protein [Polyangia bacterium]